MKTLSAYLFVVIALAEVTLIQCSPVATTLPTTINLEEYEDVDTHTLASGSPEIEIEALKFIKDVNKKSYAAYNNLAVASWNYETNITDETEAARVRHFV